MTTEQAARYARALRDWAETIEQRPDQVEDITVDHLPAARLRGEEFVIAVKFRPLPTDIIATFRDAPANPSSPLP